jgi:hypothetical protein
MITWEQIIDLARQLPDLDVVLGERLVLRRLGKDLAWERPLSKKDMLALGSAAPVGGVLAVHVGDLGIKEAWLAAEPGFLFSSPHFDGYPAVLVDLEQADIGVLRELLD